MGLVRIDRVALLLLFFAVLSGCGGGGSNSNATPVGNNTGNATTSWQPGVYTSAANFKAQCESPRTGIDPFSNAPYPDEQGTAFDEKMWLRSWTNNTYLWYDEVDDNDPENFTVASYFDQLKTNALTPTGALKDNFHFSQSTDEYNTLAQTGVSSSYGVSWEFVSTTPPRRLVVRYTEPNSPAALANVPRGASLQRVDGIDFVNNNTQAGVDALNAALFPSESGQSANFEFVLLDGSPLEVTLTAQDIEVSPVQNVRVLDSQAGRTGYFQFNTFIRTAQEDLISSFAQFVDANVTELVIDLRYNGGGLLALASQLSYMVAGPNQTDGLVFERSMFNDKHPTVNPVTGNTIQATPFYSNVIDYNANTLTNTLLPSVSLTRVYVITTGATCSASEAVINALRGIDVEVVQIGSPTCGKPYGFYPTDNCGTTYFTIQFQGVNEKGFGDFADGFIPTSQPSFDFELPGCAVEDDFTAALGNPEEGMLATALHYAATGSCPAETVTATVAAPPSTQTNEVLLSIKQPNQLKQTLFLHNKIHTPALQELQP